MLQNKDDVSNISIIDFGLSRELKNTEDQLIIQEGGQCSGTPCYIAPEVINLKVSTASDIWALGVVMYACLTGILPFEGDTIN